MIVNILIILESSIFFILAAIHFYWVIGGTWGFDQALPTNEKGERLLNPRKIDSAIVGIGLSLFGLFFLLKTNWFSFTLPTWIMKYGAYAVAVIFILRAIGDFKYVGLFKKIKDTEFAKMDNKVYVPLCLVLGLMAGLIGSF